MYYRNYIIYIIVAILVIGVSWGVALAQGTYHVTKTPYACEQIAVSYNSASNLTKSTYEPSGDVPPPSRAVLSLETGHIRWRADGTDPTLTTGFIVTIDSAFTERVLVLENVNAIRNFSALGLAPSQTLNVCYER